MGHLSNMSTSDTSGALQSFAKASIPLDHKVSLQFAYTDQAGDFFENEAAFGSFPATLEDVITVPSLSEYLSTHLTASMTAHGLKPDGFQGLMACSWNQYKQHCESTGLILDRDVWETTIADLPTRIGFSMDPDEAQISETRNIRTSVFVFYNDKQMKAAPMLYYDGFNPDFALWLNNTDNVGYTHTISRFASLLNQHQKLSLSTRKIFQDR